MSSIFQKPMVYGSSNFKNVLYYCPPRIQSTFQQMIAIESSSKNIIAASNSFLTDRHHDDWYEKQYGMYRGLLVAYDFVVTKDKSHGEHIQDRIVMISNSFTGTNSGHDLGTLLASLLYIRNNELQNCTFGVHELGFKFPRILEILELFYTKWKVFGCELVYFCESMDFVTVDPRFIVIQYKDPHVISLIQEIKHKSHYYMISQGSSPPKNAKIVLIKQRHNTNIRNHDSFYGANFLASMGNAGWIILNPEFDDMRYMISILAYASHIVLSYGAIQWTHMLFFNPDAKITFFEVGGEVAYQPVAEMKNFSPMCITDTNLDSTSNSHLFGELNIFVLQEWTHHVDAERNGSTLLDLFQELLDRQPKREEFLYHMSHFHEHKRMEFLNCVEYNSHHRNRSKRAAILVCGQVSHFDICFPSFADKVLRANAADVIMDVFIATQDTQTTKPRKGIENQYLFHRIDPQPALKQSFGSRLKKIVVRETYDILTRSQRTDRTLGNHNECVESLCDFKLCLQFARTYSEENNISYDCYICVRPDLIYAQDVLLYSMPQNTFVRDSSNDFFVCDESVANIVGDIKTTEQSTIREQSLESFLAQKKVDFIDGGPNHNVSTLGWLISEIKNGNLNRCLQLHSDERIRIEQFAARLTPCVFDIKQCMT